MKMKLRACLTPANLMVYTFTVVVESGRGWHTALAAAPSAAFTALSGYGPFRCTAVEAWGNITR